jgi:hypothetical protein
MIRIHKMIMQNIEITLEETATALTQGCAGAGMEGWAGYYPC